MKCSFLSGKMTVKEGKRTLGEYYITRYAADHLPFKMAAGQSQTTIFKGFNCLIRLV